MSAHGEGTVFPLSSYSYNSTLAGIYHINHRTAVTPSRSLLPISFSFLAVTDFHLSENVSISIGTILVPLVPVTGALSLYFLLLGLCFLLHFLRWSPVLSMTFWISHSLCVVFPLLPLGDQG